MSMYWILNTFILVSSVINQTTVILEYMHKPSNLFNCCTLTGGSTAVCRVLLAGTYGRAVRQRETSTSFLQDHQHKTGSSFSRDSDTKSVWLKGNFSDVTTVILCSFSTISQAITYVSEFRFPALQSLTFVPCSKIHFVERDFRFMMG